MDFDTPHDKGGETGTPEGGRKPRWVSIFYDGTGSVLST